MFGLFNRRNRKSDDEAQLVSFLAANPWSTVLDVQLKMKDYTMGREDWMYRDEQHIYRALTSLMADGAVRRRYSCGAWEFSLIAPEQLIQKGVLE